MTCNLLHMHVFAFAFVCYACFLTHDSTLVGSKAHAIDTWTRSFLRKAITFYPPKIHNKWMASSVCVVCTICISFARSPRSERKTKKTHYMYKKNPSFNKEQNIVNQKIFRQKYGTLSVCLFESNLYVGYTAALFRARMLFTLCAEFLARQYCSLFIGLSLQTPTCFFFVMELTWW